MIQNKKFEKAARSRKMLALSLAIALHTALFTAFVFKAEVKQLLPDFIKELLFKPAEAASATASIP
ncbi:MAG: hypothetical protein R2830_13105 [Saprospiraceae bacterium]